LTFFERFTNFLSIVPQLSSVGALHAFNGLLSGLMDDPQASPAPAVYAALVFAEASMDIQLERAAARIFELYQSQLPQGVAFAHCALKGPVDAMPLWLRAVVVPALRSLVGHEVAILLVTGIREGLNDSSKVWTARQSKEYQAAIDYIERLLSRYSAKNRRFQLIVI
jgi:hypothetical protein